MSADRPMPLLEGSVLDLRRAWPMPTTTEQLLQAAAEKADPRRFTGEPLTGFGELDDAR